MIEVSGLGSLKKVRRRGRVSHGFMDGRQRMATIDRELETSIVHSMPMESWRRAPMVTRCGMLYEV